MTYLEAYIDQLKNSEVAETVCDVTNQIFGKHLEYFDYSSSITGLLLGEVQSGKTGQIFGIISKAIDQGFEVFVLITTDNNKLQEQTFRRALECFSNICVCNETDSIRFYANKMIKPVLIILKKNINVLKKWRNHLSNSSYLDGRPIFIIDDEADAASLNTKINQNSISTINQNISNMRDMASSCVYLQVTATPQAVLLQSIISGYKPSFVTYFNPGKAYIGGDFFFSKPAAYSIRYTDDDELQSLKDESTEISFGLASAVLCFLIITAYFKITGYSQVCNFLVHPSVRIKDHQIIATKIGEFLNDILSNYDDEIQIQSFRNEYDDIYKSKPDIRPFSEIMKEIRELLFSCSINIITLNSKSDYDSGFDNGYNIVIGGNTLGRGVTFPMLQVVYYSRHSKTPQADTFWQHCRMFGYDRDRGLIRVFITRYLHKLFQDLNNSQNALVRQVTTKGIEDTHLYYIDGIRPTRKCIIDTEKLFMINGGVHYFPEYPVNHDYEKISELVNKYSNSKYITCNVELITSILSLISSEYKEDWNQRSFINAIDVYNKSNEFVNSTLIVRRNRRLQKGTGTMLSENDRLLADSFPESIVLVLYEVTGETDLGWSGSPLWIPNIKLPEGNTFYKIE